MRKHFKAAVIFSFITVLMLSAGIYWAASNKKVWAANSSLSLSSAAQTITQGQNLVVTIKVNTGGDPVNVVQANLTYPTAIFDTATISNSTSFSIVAENTASGGTIKIGRGTFTPVTGTADVATITLHASGSGTAALNFAPGSLVVRSTDNVNTLATSSGGTYTVSSSSSSPPPAPPPTTQPADLNKDGVVNIFDLSILLSGYGSNSTTGDLNSDGTVNVFDLSILLSSYNK